MIILSRFSNPSILLCFPGLVLARWNFLARAFHNTSVTRLDLPDPETPDTTVNTPKGISTVIFLRLLCFTPFKVIHFPLLVLLSGGDFISHSFLKYFAVIDVLSLATISGLPETTTSPP